jgi:hypothetical protein
MTSVYWTKKIKCQSNTDKYEAKNVVDSTTPTNTVPADTKTKFSLMNCRTCGAVRPGVFFAGFSSVLLA